MNRSVNSDVRAKILKRDGFQCRYCGAKNTEFHLDHVYPFSKGGETSEKNLVTACSVCNERKHDRVGLYPKPIGYFDLANRLLLKNSIVHFFATVSACLSAVGLVFTGNLEFVFPIVLGAVLVLVNLFYGQEIAL